MIRLSNIVKKYQQRVLLNDINLTINDGDFLVITGASGEGKSTLLNIIGLLDYEYSGKIFIDDTGISPEDMTAAYEIRRNKMGYVFQDSLINEAQTVYRNLSLPLFLSPFADVAGKVRQALEITGLAGTEQKKAIVLSGGEKQRLSVARAIIRSPSVILADEPTASLDHKNKIKIVSLLDKINRDGVSIIVVTHDTDYFSDKKIMSLRQGILYEK